MAEIFINGYRFPLAGDLKRRVSSASMGFTPMYKSGCRLIARRMMYFCSPTPSKCHRFLGAYYGTSCDELFRLSCKSSLNRRLHWHWAKLSNNSHLARQSARKTRSRWEWTWPLQRQKTTFPIWKQGTRGSSQTPWVGRTLFMQGMINEAPSTQLMHNSGEVCVLVVSHSDADCV